ncbi:MAG: hypothetical protein GPJ51_07055 [Candidatus Heimdallarchaeota archaeon]|nr:hypothetical protein [Candidatus Heimdallarchaeota archaeon]
MSFERTKRTILNRVTSNVADWVKGKNTIYWDHDLFPGIIFKFPDSLVKRSLDVSAMTAIKSYVNMVVPDKSSLVDSILEFGDMSAAEIKSTKEWNEILSHLSRNLRQIMVRTNEAVIIYWKGQVLDIAEEPGVYDIDRGKQIPGIELVYISTQELREQVDPKTGKTISQEGLLWGCGYQQGPAILIADDPEYANLRVKVGVNGAMTLKVANPEAFFNNLVGSDEIDSSFDLAKVLGLEINQAFARQMTSRNYKMIVSNFQFLGDAISEDSLLKERLEEYGLNIEKMYIKGVTPDPEKAEFISKVIDSSLDIDEIMERKEMEKKIRLAETKEAVAIHEGNLRRTEVVTSEEQIAKDLELERDIAAKKEEAESYVVERTGDAEVEKAKTAAQAAEKAIDHTKDLLKSVGASRGVQVVQPGVAVSQPTDKPEEEGRFCMFCGTKIPMEAEFCFKCGKEQKK